MPAIARIGTFDVISFDGRLRGARRRAALATRVAVDGTGVLWDAWRCDPCDVTTVALVSTNALTVIEQYRAIVGAKVTITDPLGVSWPSTLVLDVDTDLDRVAYPANSYQLTARWRFLPASIAPAGGAP